MYPSTTRRTGLDITQYSAETLNRESIKHEDLFNTKGSWTPNSLSGTFRCEVFSTIIRTAWFIYNTVFIFGPQVRRYNDYRLYVRLENTWTIPIRAVFAFYENYNLRFHTAAVITV